MIRKLGLSPELDREASEYLQDEERNDQDPMSYKKNEENMHL